ncbi:hypothetical protein N431DRAFT_435404 [Stipitochalara longipes BDJ]|nr:hypothetical protein N431DRAFT_435404 [Stipitochalara longipes BDJ]
MAMEIHTFDEDGGLILILPKPLEKENESANDDSGTTSRTFDPTDLASIGKNSFAQIEQSPVEKVRMLVSSKHMRVASPVFRAMLQQKNFKEGRELSSKGGLELPLPDDDAIAMIVLLDVIHGRNRRVPRKIDLDLVNRISILVDKYQMAEAVGMVSDVWIDNLRNDIPKEYDPNVIEVHRWLAISWVFGRGDVFKTITKLVQCNCYSDLEFRLEDNLPIPKTVIDAIKRSREEAIFEAFQFLDETVKRCLSPISKCSRKDSWKVECDCMLLGSLLKSAAAAEIYPIPESPYRAISVKQLSKSLRTFEIKTLCEQLSKTDLRISGSSHWFDEESHDLQREFNQLSNSIEKRFQGLDIEVFRS